ncbi:MAG: AMP-binding protein, partial [Ilumatobacteraceae bacterium]
MITSLGDIVEQHAETFPDKAAIIQEGVTWTYRDLRELSRRAAQGLLEAGVGEQER